MKKMIAALALVAVTLLPVRAIAQAAHDHPYDSPKATISVERDLVVGTAILKPGSYKFQCRTFDGKTFLVFTAADNGREIVRVPCVKETLDAQVSETEFRSIARADGRRVLVSVRIRGEAFGHNVVIDE
jgi:hypothetical protein